MEWFNDTILKVTCKDKGTIAGELVNLELYDLSGKKLSRVSTKEDHVIIQTDHLKTGTYYVKIINDNY